jgi:hypothetical protein
MFACQNFLQQSCSKFYKEQKLFYGHLMKMITDAFAAAWDDWLAGAREVLDSLDAMTGAMAATRADLQITDGGVAATGTSLRERLG